MVYPLVETNSQYRLFGKLNNPEFLTRKMQQFDDPVIFRKNMGLIPAPEAIKKPMRQVVKEFKAMLKGGFTLKDSEFDQALKKRTRSNSVDSCLLTERESFAKLQPREYGIGDCSSLDDLSEPSKTVSVRQQINLFDSLARTAEKLEISQLQHRPRKMLSIPNADEQMFRKCAPQIRSRVELFEPRPFFNRSLSLSVRKPKSEWNANMQTSTINRRSMYEHCCLCHRARNLGQYSQIS